MPKAGNDGREPQLAHDALHGAVPAYVKYFIPDLGVIQLDYAGDYGTDLSARSLDPERLSISTAFEHDGYALLKMRRWQARCVPNHEGREFVGWQMADFLDSLSLLRDSMPDIQALIDRHFPPEARL